MSAFDEIKDKSAAEARHKGISGDNAAVIGALLAHYVTARDQDQRLRPADEIKRLLDRERALLEAMKALYSEIGDAIGYNLGDDDLLVLAYGEEHLQSTIDQIERNAEIGRRRGYVKGAFGSTYILKTPCRVLRFRAEPARTGRRPKVPNPNAVLLALEVSIMASMPGYNRTAAHLEIVELLNHAGVEISEDSVRAGVSRGRRLLWEPKK